ncbi:gas vesicle accessory protein GvpU [Bacillus gobiensis]|uniref:gas vesicle accessory protein GvpU n=1 Tax=Bacillus gobiensis TaxID=1441095 RepID=UPI003D2300B8
MTSSPSKDSTLEFFVKASNKHEFSLDITLNVNGSVVTGTIISAHEYFEMVSETFEDGNEIAQKISEGLAKASESAKNSSQESDIGFIHLKNTRIYNGDGKGTPSKGDILWRGKLDQVDGFFLGRISEG